MDVQICKKNWECVQKKLRRQAQKKKWRHAQKKEKRNFLSFVDDDSGDAFFADHFFASEHPTDQRQTSVPGSTVFLDGHRFRRCRIGRRRIERRRGRDGTRRRADARFRLHGGRHDNIFRMIRRRVGVGRNSIDFGGLRRIVVELGFGRRVVEIGHFGSRVTIVAIVLDAFPTHESDDRDDDEK